MNKLYQDAFILVEENQVGEIVITHLQTDNALQLRVAPVGGQQLQVVFSHPIHCEPMTELDHNANGLSGFRFSDGKS